MSHRNIGIVDVSNILKKCLYKSILLYSVDVVLL
jgi:hypothetical protein